MVEDFRTWAQNGVHFGTPFFAKSVPWVPWGGSVPPKVSSREGSKMGPKTRAKRIPKVSSFGVHFGAFSGPDRDQVVFAKNAPRLGERHYFYVPGSHFHNFWDPFSVPFS